MNVEGLSSAGSLGTKLSWFLVFMGLDIGITSYTCLLDVHAGFKTTNRDVNTGFMQVLMWITTSLQAIIHFCIIFWYFFLVWKTFLFRFGLLERLSREFVILKLVPLNFVIFVVERVFRLYVTLFIVDDNERLNISTIYEDWRF